MLISEAIMIEVPLLDEIEVRAAEVRKEPYGSHPLILALDRNIDRIGQLVSRYFDEPIESKLKYVKVTSPVLIDIVSSADPYELNPYQMVGVWARIMELFPDEQRKIGYCPAYHREQVGEVISNVYAVSGMENSAWKEFPYSVAVRSELPQTAKGDWEGAKKVFDRLEAVRLNVNEVSCYMTGTRIEPNDLLQGVNQGDSEALKTLESYKEMLAKRCTPTISSLCGNFGGSFMHGHHLLYQLFKES